MPGAVRGSRRRVPLRPMRPVYLHKRVAGVPYISPTTKLPLQWSFTIATTINTTTVLTDDEDAWRVPLQWSFLIDVDPPDDVEDGYTYDVFTATFLEDF